MKKFLLFLFLSSASGSLFAQLYYSDVAPIFISRCTSCHHENQHAASLMNYTEVVNNASNISTYLTSGYMPPWSADTTYSRFLHERLITTDEKNKILTWIAGGTLRGDTTLAPTPPLYPQYQLYGTPDLELQIPTFTSNASGTDSYVCFSIPSTLIHDRVVRAYEIVPGTPSIVHHVVVNVDTTGTTTSDLSGDCFTSEGDFCLGGYAPGAPPTVFPSTGPIRMGIKIKAFSNIVMQIHYPAGTSGTQDSTKIRLYFYPLGALGVRKVNVSVLLRNTSLDIQENTKQSFTARFPETGYLSNSMSLFAVFPHSHNIATSIVNYAYLGTDTIPLIRINDWDFNRQGFYTFRHLTHISPGYALFAKHDYDNTSANPNNPSSPPINVHNGPNTTDEMLADAYMWLKYQPGDELYNIDSILQFDPLLNGVNETAAPSIALRTYAYPNPFENYVNIGYVMKDASSVTIEIYSILGTLVKTIHDNFETAGTHEIHWDGRNDIGEKVTGGSYLYIVKTLNQQSNGKLLLISN